MEKRYYWLKFKDDFFDSKRIKKLRKLAGGDTYIIIYLKMQLKALRTDGILEFTGVEENFADELALDIDESPEDVRIVLTYLLNYGLCECSDNVHYFLPYVVENTGSETAGTQRWRDWKNRKALESNTTPTLPQHTANADIENREREKSKSKNIGDKHHHPTLEEVKEYCSERGNKVDPERWFDYYTSNGWKVGKNPMKDWKAAVRTWERTDEGRANKKTGPHTFFNYKEKGECVDLKSIEATLDTDFGGPPEGLARSRKNNTLLNYNETQTEVKPIELNLEEL